LIDLQYKKEISDTLLQNLQNKEIQLYKLLEENTNIKLEIKDKKNQIITRSREEAEEYLQKLNKDFEKLVREWKESQEAAKDELSKSIRKQIQTTRTKISEDIEISQRRNIESKSIIPLEGDDVILKETGQTGNIIRIKKNKALVLFGNIKTEIALNKLQKAEKQIQKTVGKSYNTTIYSIKKELFIPVLDIRGYRRNEALHEVEIYLDKAILHDFSQLKIIHGYGDGILKQAIRSILKKYSFIKDFHSEHADHGGDGVTIIEL